MTCEHLIELENLLTASSIKETSRGQAWGRNCREWVYFDCILDLPSLRERLPFADCVEDHEHLGTHDGCEKGLYCAKCQDGIMGIHPEQGTGKVFG